MNSEMLDLLKKFKEIKRQKYIKGIGKGLYSCGDTFERLLGKERDEFSYADYNGIEIKTKNATFNYPVALFAAEPDGKYLFANENLVNKYGYKKKGKDLTFFHLIVSGDKKTRYIKNYFQLDIDYDSQEIVLKVFDYQGNLIDDDTRWSFDLIKYRFEYKTKILALVKYYTTTRNKEKYFWYYSIEFYSEFLFEKFLEEIKNGNISIYFSFDEYKSGKNIGKRHNHGTAFKINRIGLKNIYKKRYHYF